MHEIEASLEGPQSIELDNAFYIEDGAWIESYTISATENLDLAAIAEDVPGVTLFDSRTVPTGPSSRATYRLLVSAMEPYPFILGIVLRQGAIPNRVVLRNQEFNVIGTVQSWESIRALSDEVMETFGKFDLISVKEIEYTGEPLDSGNISDALVTKLTDDQLEVLGTAYEKGFFAVPRECSADEIAEELGIATSTLSERLRTAEANLLSLIYGSSDHVARQSDLENS